MYNTQSVQLIKRYRQVERLLEKIRARGEGRGLDYAANDLESLSSRREELFSALEECFPGLTYSQIYDLIDGYQPE